jgi:hypothetical protein
MKLIELMTTYLSIFSFLIYLTYAYVDDFHPLDGPQDVVELGVRTSTVAQ